MESCNFLTMDFLWTGKIFNATETCLYTPVELFSTAQKSSKNYFIYQMNLLLFCNNPIVKRDEAFYYEILLCPKNMDGFTRDISITTKSMEHMKKKNCDVQNLI